MQQMEKVMARYRSTYDPYDVQTKQPFEEFEDGPIRIRLFDNRTWQGPVWKFDVHEVKQRRNGEEFFRGIQWSPERLQNLIRAAEKALERCSPMGGVIPPKGEARRRLPHGYGKEDMRRRRK
jgi:hypothetical protein